jgi:uncharacterized protein YjeT (DUF2065 family)
MRYRNIIIALGFVTILIQFLGFPEGWRNAFYAVIGLAVIALAYVGKDR